MNIAQKTPLQRDIEAIDDSIRKHKGILSDIQSRLGTNDELPSDFEEANNIAHELINFQFLRNLKVGVGSQ